MFHCHHSKILLSLDDSEVSQGDDYVFGIKTEILCMEVSIMLKG